MDGDQQQEQQQTDALVVDSEISSGIAPISTAVPPAGPEGSITWTASEFIAHEKNARWYLLLGLATIVLAALVWFLTKDMISTITVIAAATILALAASKKPRIIEYRIGQDGLHIAQRDYPFELFRSFAIVHEGAFSSLVFIPLKRFAMLTTAYYDPLDESKIIDLLASRIPLEEKKRDLVETIMWKIRY